MIQNKDNVLSEHFNLQRHFIVNLIVTVLAKQDFNYIIEQEVTKLSNIKRFQAMSENLNK